MIFPLPLTPLINNWVRVSVICFTLFRGVEAGEPAFTQEQMDILASGEIVFLEPEAPYLFTVAVQIKAPAALVWEVMRDQERLPRYVKGLRESNILETGENWKIIEQRLKLHPIFPQFYYVFREEYGPGYQIRFQSVRGSFKELKGLWKIIPEAVADRVILLYSTYVDVGWFIPKFWIKRGIHNQVPELLYAFRKEVYSELEQPEENEGGP